MHHISFPRWIHYKSNYSIEIHGFCDASQQAIAAVVYIRVNNNQNEVQTSILASKSKVAPLKRLTIPQLELCGACLLTKFVSHLINVLKFNNVPIYLWTDSFVTYTWIINHPSRWKDFVQNRVCFIQDTLPQAKWRFVPGNENPADLATRGLTPIQLSEQIIWWKGPFWLLLPSTDWPIITTSTENNEILEEKPVKSNVVRNDFNLWDLIFKYSSLTKLFRITAYCQRAISHFKRRSNISNSSTLTVKELEEAKLLDQDNSKNLLQTRV